MKLIECYIENFGKLSDFKLNFSKGLNSIKENNGYGKTTLSVFIKAMLYGLDDTKRQKLESNDRKHYMPWQGGRCGGSLSFEANGKIYRIERTFMPKASEDTFKLYDEKSGKESFDFTENVGEELFKIDADGFERTVFLSETNLSGKNENKTVSAKLSNLVGCDGDLSAMDDAIELLEKQRKIYFKRGGSGEIGDIKAKLSSVEREIFDLERMKVDYSNEKIRLDEISNELLSDRKKREELNKKTKSADEAKIKKALVMQYREMTGALDLDIQRERELESFFKSGVPQEQQTQEIKARSLEAKRIKETVSFPESQELKQLREFFAEVPEGAYLKAKDLPEQIESKKRESALLSEQLPKREKNEKEKNGWQLFLILGMISILASIAIGLLLSPLLLAISVVGLILIIIATGKKAKAEKIRATIKKESEINSRIFDVNSEIKALESDACQFISLFNIQDTGSVSDTIRDIFRKRDLYSALKNSHNQLEKNKARQIELANESLRECEAFLSRFPTVSQTPFEEITRNSLELGALKKTIEAKRLSMESFANKHGINPTELDAYDNLTLDSSASEEGAEIEARILRLEREKTLAERRLSELSDEIERIDELSCEKERLYERAAILENKVNVILKAKSFLSEAKDNLTAKYLSKTKSAFDRYMALIGGTDSEGFSMNTSFEIMKNEKGTLRDAVAYSRGTRDLYALVARLALIDSLYEDEEPFIILDDPFAYFDDFRLKNALSVIEKLAKEKQIIYLTCTDSRKI